MRTPRTLVATLVAVALLAFGASTASAETRAEDTPIAIANGDLVDAEGTQVGQVLTIDDGETALWFVAAEGLSPGLHGLQLRQTGDCGSDFADTGARITGT